MKLEKQQPSELSSFASFAVIKTEPINQTTDEHGQTQIQTVVRKDFFIRAHPHPSMPIRGLI
jgi:hypothetical protein